MAETATTTTITNNDDTNNNTNLVNKTPTHKSLSTQIMWLMKKITLIIIT